MLKFAMKEFIFLKIVSDGGHRQAVKTMDCGSIMRGFESHCPPHLQKESH